MSGSHAGARSGCPERVQRCGESTVHWTMVVVDAHNGAERTSMAVNVAAMPIAAMPIEEYGDR